MHFQNVCLFKWWSHNFDIFANVMQNTLTNLTFLSIASSVWMTQTKNIHTDNRSFYQLHNITRYVKLIFVGILFFQDRNIFFFLIYSRISLWNRNQNTYMKMRHIFILYQNIKCKGCRHVVVTDTRVVKLPL